MKKISQELVFQIISMILAVICIICLSIFSYYLIKVNVIPLKYIIVIAIALILFLSFIYLTITLKKNKKLKIIGLSIILLSSFGFVYLTGYLENTYKFLTGLQVNEYSDITYRVVVLKSSNYKNIEDLDNKKIGYLDDNKKDINTVLNNNIKYKEKLFNNLDDGSDKLLNKNIDALVIEDNYYNLLKEEVGSFKKDTKVIHTFTVKVKSHKEGSSADINKEPFILYISGIDQYGNVSNVRGRSDVNQILVVNPKTNHILLVNTPRDYYVKLNGTTGLKDKLTHAGIYGVDKSIKTLEDLYNIDIDYYLRVNFDSLIKVVDAIGGIDINSDKAFTAYTNNTVQVKKGMNHFNGEQALAYARERYAYETGDNHRGENQQQVIGEIIKKITSSKVLLKNYNDILNTLDGTFETDMSSDLISAFIKRQVNNPSEWLVESIQVTGKGSSNYTYSMGKKNKLYVMEPNMESVKFATNEINGVLNED